ncbi:MAG: alpha/beta hydrolase [Myxococcota bacterium]
MSSVSIDTNVSIHYRQDGFEHTSKPVVVFLNGMTQTTMSWRTQARRFQDDFRVLTYDARGQGKSDVGEDELTLTRHAEDLILLLDHLDIHTAHLVGFSHGARVALAAAGHAPERLGKLVLCSATAQPTALAKTIVRAWREVLSRGGLEAMSWAALPTILGTDFLEANEGVLDGVIRAGVQRNSPGGITRLLDAMIAYPALDELARRVQAPTLVVSADADPLVDPAGARLLAELCKGTHTLVPHSGHTIPIERPGVFQSIVEEFLS